MRTPIAVSLIMVVVVLAPACGNEASLATKPDAAQGSGGGGGQISMTGGTSGPRPDGSPGSGGALVSGGSMAGGTPGGGGSTSTGGRPGTGGLPGAGGGPGTGGTGSPDGAYADASIADAAIADASRADGTACSCSPGGLTWDCYCGVYDCSITLSRYQPDGGLPTSVRAIREYADCNLVVVTYRFGFDPEVSKVFDLTTGVLVGDQKTSDAPLNCPFGDSGTIGKLSAGRFPDASCSVTKCIEGPAGASYCGVGGTGGTGGMVGAGGAGGAAAGDG